MLQFEMCFEVAETGFVVNIENGSVLKVIVFSASIFLGV